MQLEQQRFIQEIRNRLAEGYTTTGKLVSLEFACSKMNISKPTLSRVLQGKKFDLQTFLEICTWLDKPVTDFISVKKNECCGRCIKGLDECIHENN